VSHNALTYHNPGHASLVKAMPMAHIRGKGDWRNTHQEQGMNLDDIGAAALRLATSGDAMTASFETRTANMAQTQRHAHGRAVQIVSMLTPG
jgi:hypothetical protein